MSLTIEEASLMLRGGNSLKTVVQPLDVPQVDAIYPIGYEIDEDGKTRWLVEPERPNEPLKAGFGRYILLGTCKFLETSDNGWEFCSIYDQRPKVCSDFEVGSPKCQTIRERAGIPVPVELITKPHSD